MVARLRAEPTSTNTLQVSYHTVTVLLIFLFRFPWKRVCKQSALLVVTVL